MAIWSWIQRKAWRCRLLSESWLEQWKSRFRQKSENSDFCLTPKNQSLNFQPKVWKFRLLAENSDFWFLESDKSLNFQTFVWILFLMISIKFQTNLCISGVVSESSLPWLLPIASNTTIDDRWWWMMDDGWWMMMVDDDGGWCQHQQVWLSGFRASLARLLILSRLHCHPENMVAMKAMKVMKDSTTKKKISKMANPKAKAIATKSKKATSNKVCYSIAILLLC